MHRNKRRLLGLMATAVLASIDAPVPSSATEKVSLHCDQQATMADISRGTARAPLEAVRRNCPMLGEIIRKFAMQDLGETFPAENPMTHPREIATVVAALAAGDVSQTRIKAHTARANGAAPVEFEEMLYVMAVNDGIPKAIEATQVLSDVLVAADLVACTEWSPQRESQF
jgi:alkylhydroperoxidase/carboxymuconolactone decarboxylase family protein YurZ